MEQPVTLKSAKRTVKRSNSSDCSGRVCIVHFECSKDERLVALTEQSFSKIQDAARERLQSEAKHRLHEITDNLPEVLDKDKHGYHRWCYQKYTNLYRNIKRSSTDEISPGPSTSKRRRTSTEILFPSNKCLFCEKETIKSRGVKQNLVKCVTKSAEEAIKEAANKRADDNLKRKILEQDLVAREAHYHNLCRRNYTRDAKRHPSATNTETYKSQKAHEEAFDFIFRYVEQYIVVGHNIERLTMIKDRYLNYLLEKYPSVYNENYKTYKLKDKLMKHFGDNIRFWQPSQGSELVYSAGVPEGQAIGKAYELTSSDEKLLEESALIIRRHIYEHKRLSSEMPWPPSASWLLSASRKPPDILVQFILAIISGNPGKPVKCIAKSQRIALSLSQDICYAATNGVWVMPKHSTLPMTVRHLTGNAELITILNRFGHRQSYSRTLELETAMCNEVVTRDSVLPNNISADNNAVIHFCWDNFDLNEETPSGTGTTHSTHGIVIQELSEPNQPTPVDNRIGVKTRERTVKPKESEIHPCYSKEKVEPNLQVVETRPEDKIAAFDVFTFVWILCRAIGSTFEQKSVPSWAGWLSQTSEARENNKTIVEYMAPLNVSINDNATVNHILELSQNASQAVNQAYTIVTFDLAVAKKAYALVWQYSVKFSNVIVRMGVFHTICSVFGALGKMMRGSGLSEIIIEAGICASGSLDKVMSGKHFNRALRVHKLTMEALERQLLSRFEETHPRTDGLGNEAIELLQTLAENPNNENLVSVIGNQLCKDYYDQYCRFKDTIRHGHLGKTAQFWLMYVDLVLAVLALIRATKENDLGLHIASLFRLCPLFFAYDHVNYARYVPVYLITLLNLGYTHPGSVDLLKNNGFSVARSSVPRSRNTVDITIEQTINRHAKCQGGIVGFSRNYAAYYRWCMTRHCRATLVEATLLMTDMASEEVTIHKELQDSHIQGSEEDVQKVMAAVSGFTDPFHVDNSDEMFCLSSGLPAPKDVADDLLNASDLGEKSMHDFIKERLVEKTVPFHSPIKRMKLKTFASVQVTKKIQSSKNKLTQIKAERNVFGQLVVLSVKHDIDLESTLSYPLSPVPFALATGDGMPVKTDKSKLMHYLETCAEPTTIRPVDNTAYVLDGNAILQSLTSIPDTFEDLAEMIFNLLPKAYRVDFVTDTYYPQSIKSFERIRRGSSPTLLLAGPKTKTPRDWKSFMSNDNNKRQLINLIFEQWKTAKYSSKLKEREVYVVSGEECHRLTSIDGQTVIAEPQHDLFSSQEEADTRIILHCLHISNALPADNTIIVRSPDTDVFILLTKYVQTITQVLLFDTGMGNKRRLLNIRQIVEIKGSDLCAVLPALHSFTGCDTTSAFVRKGKVAPLKLLEKHNEYIPTFAQLGLNQECSDDLLEGLEKFVCHLYGKQQYSDINKLRYDMFTRKYQGREGVLNTYDGIDMSLLPPCRSSLAMHSKRVNYQVFVWLHAHEQYPDLPKPEENGWRVGSDHLLEIDWNEGDIVPQQLIDVLVNELDAEESSEDENDVEFESMIDIVYEDEEADDL